MGGGLDDAGGLLRAHRRAVLGAPGVVEDEHGGERKGEAGRESKGKGVEAPNTKDQAPNGGILWLARGRGSGFGGDMADARINLYDLTREELREVLVRWGFAGVHAER